MVEEATRYIVGSFIVILLLSGGGYLLSEPTNSDICTRNSIRSSWVATGIPDQYYCDREDSYQFCQSVEDYGGTPNARCYAYTTLFVENTSDLPRIIQNFGRLNVSDNYASITFLQDIETNDTKNYTRQEFLNAMITSEQINETVYTYDDLGEINGSYIVSKLRKNFVRIDTNKYPHLNRPARVVFKDITWDRNTVGIYHNGVWRPDVPLTFSGTDIIADVPGFSEWTIQQTVFDGTGTNFTLLSGNLSKGGDTSLVMFFDNLNVVSNSTFTGDESIYGNDGTVVGATHKPTGGNDSKGSYYFDGTDDWITFTDSESLSFSTESTISAWFNRTGSTGDGQMIVAKNPAEANQNFRMLWSASNILQCRWRNTSTGAAFSQISGISATNQWYHAVCTYNGTHVTAYVDGVAGTPSFLGGNLEDNGNWYIGASDEFNPGRDLEFLGEIDDVQMWNRSLSLAEIIDLNNSRTKYIYQQGMNYTDNHSVTEQGVPLDSNNYWKWIDFTGNTSNMVVKGLNCSTAGCSSSDTNWQLATQSGNRFTFPDLTLPGDYFNISIAGDDTRDSSLNLFNYSITGNNNTRPNVTDVVINNNITHDNTTSNLTATWTYADAENDPQHNITDWRVNSSSYAVINMPFEGGSTSTLTLDYSSYGNDGNVNSATWNRTGGISGSSAYEFDGVDDKIEITHGSSINFNYNNYFTLSAWVKTTTSGALDIINKWASSGNAQGYLLAKDGSNRLDCNIRESSGVYRRTQSTTTLNDGLWHYVVCVYNGDGNNPTIYIDGVNSSDTLTQSGTLSTITNTDSLKIGVAQTGVTRYWNGTIDQVQIFNRALSEDQILAIYNNRSDLLSSDETSKGDVWEVCVTPNDGYEDGTTVCSSKISINNKPELTSLNITSSSGTNTTNENLTWVATFTDKDGDSVKNISDWKLNGSSIAVLNTPFEVRFDNNESQATKDYSDFSNDGTVTGATWNATGGYDGQGAYEFDGVNDYINHGNDASLTSFSQMTGMAWIKTNSSQIAQAIFGKWGDGTLEYRIILNVFGTGDIYVDLRTGAGNSITYTNTVGITDDVFHHIAYTWDGSNGNVDIYLDGVIQSEASGATGATGSIVSSSDNFHIGSVARSGISQYFNGTIDEVKIFNRTLSADQILAIYNNRTDLISSDETSLGDNWSVCVTPNDGFEDGTTVCSENLTIIEAVANNAPTLTATTITPDPAYYNITVSANTTVTDSDGDATTVTAEWYVDSVLVHTQINSSVVSGTEIVSELDSNNYSVGQLVLVNFTATDGTDTSAQNTDTLTISNYNPSIDSVSITRGADYITASCTASDVDGSIVNYTISINGTGESSGNISSCLYTFSALEINANYNITFVVHDDFNATATTDEINTTRAVAGRTWIPQGDLLMKWVYSIKELWRVYVKQIYVVSDDGSTETKLYQNGTNLQIINNGTGNIIFNNDILSDDWIGNRTCYTSDCSAYGYHNGSEVVVVD